MVNAIATIAAAPAIHSRSARVRSTSLGRQPLGNSIRSGATVELTWEQVTNAHTQRAGEPNQVKSRAVADTPLDPAHVAAPQAGLVGEGFLRNPLLLAEFADPVAQRPECGVLGRLTCLARHTPDRGAVASFEATPDRIQ